MTHLQWAILIAVLANPLLMILYHWERLTVCEKKTRATSTRAGRTRAAATPKADPEPVEPLAIILALKRHRIQSHGSSDLLSWHSECLMCSELEEQLAMSRNRQMEAA